MGRTGKFYYLIPGNKSDEKEENETYTDTGISNLDITNDSSVGGKGKLEIENGTGDKIIEFPPQYKLFCHF